MGITNKLNMFGNSVNKKEKEESKVVQTEKRESQVTEVKEPKIVRVIKQQPTKAEEPKVIKKVVPKIIKKAEQQPPNPPKETVKPGYVDKANTTTTSNTRPKLTVRTNVVKGDNKEQQSTKESKAKKVLDILSDKKNKDDRETTSSNVHIPTHKFVDDSKVMIEKMEQNQDDELFNLTLCFGYLNRSIPNKIVINHKGIAVERNPVTNRIFRVNSIIARKSPIRRTTVTRVLPSQAGNKSILFAGICEYKTGKQKGKLRRKVCKELAVYTNGYVVFCDLVDLGKEIEFKLFAAYNMEDNKVITVAPHTAPMLRDLAECCKQILAQFNKKPFNRCALLTDRSAE